MRISDWSSDVCSSDLAHPASGALMPRQRPRAAVRIGVSGAPTAEATETGDAGGLLSVAAITAVISPARTATPISFTARFRSEEHTSELQSLMRISYAVFCLKKQK